MVERLRHRVLLVSAALLVTMASGAAPTSAQAPIDPLWIVGAWSGEGRLKTRAATFFGPFYLRINKVEGSTVTGVVEMRDRRQGWGAKYGMKPLEFEGTLRGAQLTFETYVLTIEGGQMWEPVTSEGNTRPTSSSGRPRWWAIDVGDHVDWREHGRRDT